MKKKYIFEKITKSTDTIGKEHKKRIYNVHIEKKRQNLGNQHFFLFVFVEKEKKKKKNVRQTI